MNKTTFDIMRWLENHCGDLAPYILTVNQSKSREGDYYDIVMALVVPETDIVPALRMVPEPIELPEPEKFTVPMHTIALPQTNGKPQNPAPAPKPVQVRRQVMHKPMEQDDIASLLSSEE